jgi:peptidoglycan/xylan/chitin deacetylase (PgdA/CDA1 family)
MSGRVLIAGAATAAAIAHVGPTVTGWDRLRTVLWPRLAGVGRRDGVALTFDDGPDPSGTPAVLEQLDALGWKATFFLLGTQTRMFPDHARAVVAAGHEIAVHGDVHRSHLFRTPADVAGDLQRALVTIREVTGTQPRYCRPPYGVVTSGTLRAARRTGLQPLLWTSWGKDWQRSSTPRRVVEKLDRTLGPGGTLLLHDSDCTSTRGSWRATAASLPLLAEELARRGLAVRPVREHLAPLGAGEQH